MNLLKWTDRVVAAVGAPLVPISRHPEVRGWRGIVIFAVGLVCLHALGSLAYPALLWGANFYAVLPRPVLPMAALILGAVVWDLRSDRGLIARWIQSLSIDHQPPVRMLLWVAGIFALLFWAFRIHHLLLGDGFPLVSTTLSGGPLQPLEPLTGWIQEALYGFVRGPLEWFGVHGYHVAQDSIALGSILSGCVFVIVAWFFSRDVRLRMPLAAGPPEAEASGSAHHVALWACLVSQGYMQLFFGYVENYSYYAATVLLFIWLGLRFLRNEARLLQVGLCLLVGIGLHLSGVVLLPAFVVLSFIGLLTARRRLASIVDLTVLAAGATVGLWVLHRFGAAYSLPTTLMSTLSEIAYTAGGSGDTYLFSLKHLGDVVNEQILIGPIGIVAFICAGIWRLGRPRTLEPADWFFLTLGGTYLLASIVAGDSNLGYARNWDLLAPGGIAFTASGLGLARRTRTGKAIGWNLLLALAAISLFHTAPWIGINATESGVERFKLLPLGKGRTETTIGFWYALTGRDADAEAWFRAGTATYPQNVRGYLLLGRLMKQEGRHAAADSAFRTAIKVRPDLPEARVQRADFLMEQSRYPEAAAELQGALRTSPNDRRLTLLETIACAAAGDTTAARVSRDFAHQMGFDAPPVDGGTAGGRQLLLRLWKRTVAGSASLQ